MREFFNNIIVIYLLAGLRTNTDGIVSYPVKFFQTSYFKPYQMAKLQPNGMWQFDETVYSGVVDVDGQIKIRLSKGQMPNITFETTKPVRFDVLKSLPGLINDNTDTHGFNYVHVKLKLILFFNLHSILTL